MALIPVLVDLASWMSIHYFREKLRDLVKH